MSDERDTFTWSREDVGRGWCHPVKRTDFDAARAERPVQHLQRVSLVGRWAVKGPATYFRQIGQLGEVRRSES